MEMNEVRQLVSVNDKMRRPLLPEGAWPCRYLPATARERSVSRVLFSLSLSPFASLCKYVSFPFSRRCKTILPFVGEMQVMDVT